MSSCLHRMVLLARNKKMTPMPNIITSLRMAGSLGLLFCNVTGAAFWIIYALCGISDIVDGWLARKLKCVTKTGALLDSLADICFVACCAWQILPTLELPQWLWLWAGVIVAIKVVNQLSALVMYGRCWLFIAVPMTFWSIIPITIVAAVATFAAIHEGCVLARAESSYTWLDGTLPAKQDGCFRRRGNETN